MMGWRVGYVAYPDFDGHDSLGAEILKIQDTVTICPPQLSQYVALGAMEAGASWVNTKIESLSGRLSNVRELIMLLKLYLHNLVWHCIRRIGRFMH